MTDTEPATIEEHEYSNGLVLVGEVMPGVQSAAFTLLIPAGAAYEVADGVNVGGGAATMVAEWMTRGAGSRDSRELLTALDNLGVSHSESAQTLHTSLSAATLGRNLVPSLEIFADIVLRPHFDDEEIEPIRALCLQNLRSLEDDPGTKVIYELRRRHFPEPWGRPSPGTVAGISGLTGDALRLFHKSVYRPNGAILGVAGAIDWPRLKDAVGRAFWRVEASGPTQSFKRSPADPRVTTSRARPSRFRSRWPILRPRFSARITIVPEPLSPSWEVIPRRGLFTEVREKRGLCYTVYASYESQRDRAAMLCYAGTSTDRAQQTLDVILTEIQRLGREGIELEELEMMRTGLKSSLIMAQESSMSRSSALASDWYFLGRVRPLEEISAELDALTPRSVSDYAAEFAQLHDLTILTLGPTPLRFPEGAQL